ncbi:MAG: hypothetical protein V1853_04780 [bacterium]
MWGTRERNFILIFNLYTIVLWLMVIVEFLSRHNFIAPATLGSLYLLVLTYYAGDKEIRRWRHKHRAIDRHGEYFVLIWVLTIILAYSFEIFGGKPYGFRVPGQLPQVVGGVLIIYFITEYLKSEFRRRLKKKKT